MVLNHPAGYLNTMIFSKYINQLISSESIDIKKSDTAILIKAANEPGFTTSQCWHIGGHPNNDIQETTNACMRDVRLRGFHSWPESMQQPFWSVPILHEIKKLFEEDSNNHNLADA